MTRAKGRPGANAPKIASANAESKFASGRALPANMLVSHRGTQKKPPPGRNGGGFRYSYASLA
jgi:hypothetical protein